MLHFTAIIEDTTIVATDRHDGSGLMDVIVTDGMAGKQERAVWTYNQFNAVMTLTLGMGEDGSLPPETVEKLYTITRPLFDGWAPEVIPTP